MLLILAFLYLFYSGTSAVPVSHVVREAITPDMNFPASQCMCPDQQRSIWDILWSCLATIFACTWISVHPNIPPSEEKEWKIKLRRLEVMVWAIIAPELILLWAMKQWYIARAMVKRYRGHRWTKTHAYFIEMGGFTLFEGGKPKRVLLLNEMEKLLENGKIDLPDITEEEIQDRSKGDGLSKALVIGQTSWFIAQCIARRAEQLILTELELVTAAFAILNGIMYFLWWNKPLDVRRPVPVHILDQAKPVEERFKLKTTDNYAITLWPWDAIFSLISGPLAVLASFLTWISKIRDINSKSLQKAATATIVSPWTILWKLFSRLDDIYEPSEELKVPGSVSTVSTFYSSTSYSSSITDVEPVLSSATAIIATVFGALHCAAWFFAFPTHIELIIWRTCSALISIIPLGMLLLFLTYFPGQDMRPRSTSRRLFGILWTILSIFMFSLPIYVIARLFLLGEAFAALRYLPPDALAVVDWLSFLPHI
ncbi:hypothetical protein GALMADRAFT_246490 [Galerina marginata CBS 339.88]|uniref:Uncharacterized protein n=1 Tax=Galerina marginata (strain CBS 339.88) TaxID=685588 RepID=A0A067T1Y0_GALM3|nr:hypothetical protein GALMADRAFT_246490 [Galerina marginata CBS 339.88]